MRKRILEKETDSAPIEIINTSSGGSKGGARDAPPPRSWRPLLVEILDPPLTRAPNEAEDTYLWIYIEYFPVSLILK